MLKVKAMTAPIQSYNPNRKCKKGIKQFMPKQKHINPIKVNPHFF